MPEPTPPQLRFASPFRAKANIIDRAHGITEQIVNVTGHKDSQGDTITAGAFAYLDNPVPKGVWHHEWKAWVAKSLVADELKPGSQALRTLAPDLFEAGLGGLYIKAQYNLDTQAGRDALSNVLFFDDQAEYSIGYDVLDMDPDGDGGWLLKAVPVWEWSPVLFGANELTRTLALKSAGPVPDASLVRSVLVNGLKRSDEPTGNMPAEIPPAGQEPAVPEKSGSKEMSDMGGGMVEGSMEELCCDLRDVLMGRFPDADWVTILATMTDSVTFAVWPMDWMAEPDVFRLGYTVDADGDPVLADVDPEPVELQTVVMPKRSPRGVARKALDGEEFGFLQMVRWDVDQHELAKALAVEETARAQRVKDRRPLELLRSLNDSIRIDV